MVLLPRRRLTVRLGRLGELELGRVVERDRRVGVRRQRLVPRLVSVVAAAPRRGGTHVVATGEIGPVEIGKIENKGRQNRRINLRLVTP